MKWPWSKPKSNKEVAQHDSAPLPDTLLFNLGDVVRRKYGAEQSGMIVGILYRFGGSVLFLINWADSQGEQLHYAEELKHDEGFER